MKIMKLFLMVALIAPNTGYGVYKMLDDGYRHNQSNREPNCFDYCFEGCAWSLGKCFNLLSLLCTNVRGDIQNYIDSRHKKTVEEGLSLCKEIVREGSSLLSEEEKKQKKAKEIFVAIENGNIKALERLIKGENIEYECFYSPVKSNGETWNYYTPLMFALDIRHIMPRQSLDQDAKNAIAIIEFLLKKGAKLHKKTGVNKETAWEIAKEYNIKEVMDLFLNHHNLDKAYVSKFKDFNNHYDLTIDYKYKFTL